MNKTPFGNRLPRKNQALHMRPRRHKTANALAALIAAHGLGLAARADSSDGGSPLTAFNDKPVLLPGVVVNDTQAGGVSSPKFTQPLVDVPQTVSVIPASVYGAQGAMTLSDVLRNTPGITLFAGEGGSANRTGGDSFYLRGFDTSNSIFVDGVRDEGAATHDTFNIGQVEVFKGPSADNGRGGTAGYINLETKTPQARAFGKLAVSDGFDRSGSEPVHRATLDVNQPLPDRAVSGAAFRLNLMAQSGGIPGRKLAEKNRWGVAPSLALGLGAPTRVFVSGQHQSEHNLPDYGLPATAVAGLAPPAVSPAPSFFSPGVDAANYYGFANYDYERITNDTVTVRVEHDLTSAVTLRNQTRYDRTARQVEASSPSGSPAAAPAGQAAISQGIYQTKNEILSNQTNLSADFSTGPLAHALTAGLELSRETSANPVWSLVPDGAPNPNYLVDIYHPDNFPAALVNYGPHPTGSGTRMRIDTAALYAFDTVRLGRFWEVTGGLRLERYSMHELAVTVASPAIPAAPGSPAADGAPATAPVKAVAAVPASSVDLAAGRTTVSWKGGLVFKPAPAGSLYVAVSTAARPPGASSAANTFSISTASADNPLLDPQIALNYEAGIKWNFFRDRLLATAAIFRSVNTRVPAADPVTGLVDQTSNQTVQGVELGLSGKLTKAWLVFAGYSHLDARVSQALSTNTQGLTLPLLPGDSGNLWTTYVLPFGLTLGGGVQYMGETRRLQATATPGATTFASRVPACWLASAMLSCAVNTRLTLRVNVTNLTDRHTIASLNNNGYRVNLGAPRAFLLTAELAF